MTTNDTQSVETCGPEETLAVAQDLARQIAAGQADESPVLVILLSGELGAGKTVFAKGLASGFGVQDVDDVVSPTFTLVNRYPGPVTVDHRQGAPGQRHADAVRQRLGARMAAPRKPLGGHVVVAPHGHHPGRRPGQRRQHLAAAHVTGVHRHVTALHCGQNAFIEAAMGVGENGHARTDHCGRPAQSGLP